MTNADDLDFTGRTVLVTGAGTSIGRAVVLEFAARGAWVLISDTDQTAARAVEGEVHALDIVARNARSLVLVGDATDPANVEELRRRAEAFARVDILVSTDGTWHLAQALVPGMMDGGWGRIVVLGESREASVTTRSLAADLGEYGITVNEIDVGQPEVRGAIGRAARPDEVAFAVACLGSLRSGAITGSVLHVDGGAPR